MIPPNTPSAAFWIPQTLTTVPLSTSPASDPSSRISPITFSMPLIVAFITKKEIMAASAATSFSFFAIPIATPTANMIGRLSKIMFPALLMMVSSALSTVPSPSMDSSPYVSIVVAFVKELPIPSSSPCHGKDRDRKHKASPDPLQYAKNFVFHLFSSFSLIRDQCS